MSWIPTEVLSRAQSHPWVAGVAIICIVFALRWGVATLVRRRLGSATRGKFLLFLWWEVKEFLRKPGSPAGLDFVVILIVASPTLAIAFQVATESFFDRLLGVAFPGMFEEAQVVMLLLSLAATAVLAVISFSHVRRTEQGKQRRTRKKRG